MEEIKKKKKKKNMTFNVVIFFWIFGSGVLICIQGKNDDNTRTLHQ